MKNENLISEKIHDFYSRASEEKRLEAGLGPLEFERNKELIEKHIMQPKSTIVDMGGGPGIYSEWLAILGHKVYLIDPVPKHIKQAQKRAQKLKNKFTPMLGESLHIDLPDNTADLIILHGPLYHLQRKEDRINSILEAKRVTKPGGIILGFAINYMASTLLGLLNGFIQNDEFRSMCLEELTSGNHNSPDEWPGLLPEAYFHRPEELKDEFLSSGLEFIQLFSVEGVIWLDKNYFDTRANKEKYSKLMQVNKILENDQNAISLSPHMMISSKKTLI